MLCVGVLCVCVCVWIALIHSSLEIRCIPSLNNILFSIKVCVHLMFVCMSEVTPLTLKTTFVMFFLCFFYTQTSNVPPYAHIHLYRHTHTHTESCPGVLSRLEPAPRRNLFTVTHRGLITPTVSDHMLHSSFVGFRQTVAHLDVFFFFFHTSREYLCMIQ